MTWAGLFLEERMFPAVIRRLRAKKVHWLNEIPTQANVYHFYFLRKIGAGAKKPLPHTHNDMLQ